MEKPITRTIDMTPNGDFVTPPRPSLGVIAARIAAFGIGLLLVAAAFWTALFMLPFLVLLGVIGYFAYRSRVRRGGAVIVTRRF